MCHIQIIYSNSVNSETPALLCFFFHRHISCIYLLSLNCEGPWAQDRWKGLFRFQIFFWEDNFRKWRGITYGQASTVTGYWLHWKHYFKSYHMDAHIFKTNPLFVSFGAKRDKTIFNYIIYCTYYSLNCLKVDIFNNEKSKSQFSILD